jgi:hypothetical protein
MILRLWGRMTQSQGLRVWLRLEEGGEGPQAPSSRFCRTPPQTHLPPRAAVAGAAAVVGGRWSWGHWLVATDKVGERVAVGVSFLSDGLSLG